MSANKSSTKKNEVSPSKVLENSDLKKEFERDLNDKSKVWCKTCKKPLKSVIWDLKMHLKEVKLHQAPEPTIENKESVDKQNNQRNQSCMDYGSIFKGSMNCKSRNYLGFPHNLSES